MRRKPNNKMHHNNRRGRGGRNENNTGKIKSAAANRDKYLNLARDALASGDRVESENYLQHAEHYYRVLSFLQEEDARNRPAAERHQDDAPQDAADSASDAGDDTDGNPSDDLAMAS